MGTVGLSREDAELRYGESNIEEYHTRFTALETAACACDNEAKVENPHFAKIITIPAENDRVVGFHYVGPNAGEVAQGYALGIKLGATKADFDNVVGIHPTAAEKFTTLEVKKSSGK